MNVSSSHEWLSTICSKNNVYVVENYVLQIDVYKEIIMEPNQVEKLK